ncbi:MAG: HDOD domain-containing protein [Desulfobacteraceae bacterium]|nr:HDOD domain-containing protein [Desulfobacteraceae bacterium]
MTTIQKLVKEIKDLKPIPAIVNQIVAAIDDPNCSAEDIANIIKFDPSVTTNLLKTCNSAYFGLANPVDSVKDAVSILGIDQIIELVLLKSGAKALSKKQKGYGLHEGIMWKHAVSSALIAKKICKKVNLGNENRIFTAALLKDIGKTVLDQFVSGSFEKIINLVHKDGYSFREAEKKIIGIDHGELGAMIATEWNFSTKMINIIRHHHLNDESQRKNNDIAIVYLADCICMMMGIGIGEDGLAYRFHTDVISHLNITHEDIALIIADFSQDMQKVEKLINVA